MVRVDFMLDEELNHALDELKKEEGVSKSWLIRKAIKEYLKKVR